MNKVNKRLISKIVLVILMIAMLTFFTGCAFSSSNMDLGISQLEHGIKMVFDGLVNGILFAIRSIFEGLWEFIVGIFMILIGAIAWVWELIIGLF